MQERRRPMKKIESLVVAGYAILAFAQFGFAQTQNIDRNAGKPSAVSVATLESMATVHAIDYEKRTGTLMLADGTTETFHAGPEVKDFDQIKVGDQVILRARVAR